MSTEDKDTAAAKRRYNRVATLYDLSEALMERFRYRRWRELLWSKVEGKRVLEIGVGTGKNFPFYPTGIEIDAIDFSDKMLKRAQAKAKKQNVKVSLRLMDIQYLEFEENCFDTVIASFVFCSVPDPVRGLTEVHRVCKQGGKVVLLDHVLSANRILGWLMNIANPIGVRMIGANINRRTLENVEKGGLAVEKVTDLWGGIFKLIEARKVQSLKEMFDLCSHHSDNAQPK